MNPIPLNKRFKDRRLFKIDDMVGKTISFMKNNYEKIYVVFEDGYFALMRVEKDYDDISEISLDSKIFEYDYLQMELITEEEYNYYIQKRKKLDDDSRKRYELKQLEELLNKYPCHSGKDCMVKKGEKK